MKITSAILAICAASTSAFVVPNTFTRDHTVAFSTASPLSSASKAGSKGQWDDTLDALDVTRIQGGALRTWSYPEADLERVFIALNTDGPPEGNPLKVNIELNQGPDNTPQKIDVYSGKGRLRPFYAVIETPGGSSAVFIRNNAPLEFPATAKVEPQMEGDKSLLALTEQIYEMDEPIIIQGGGAVRTWDLTAAVSSCKVILRTDGRPLYAQVELVQGPNAPKYTIDVYCEDGDERPFTIIMETPGAGNMVRIISTGSSEFPLTASVGPSTYSTKREVV
mmetsp:Transcript_19638/g.27770  ORF Transcript_19638/g.27770 Transcript_19638/m.27770 type:complete len:279 (+) Transcript_19638:119-955(+)